MEITPDIIEQVKAKKCITCQVEKNNQCNKANRLACIYLGLKGYIEIHEK